MIINHILNGMILQVVSPLRIRLWDPFQICVTSWLINGGDPNHFRPSWDDCFKEGKTLEDILQFVS